MEWKAELVMILLRTFLKFNISWIDLTWTRDFSPKLLLSASSCKYSLFCILYIYFNYNLMWYGNIYFLVMSAWGLKCLLFPIWCQYLSVNLGNFYAISIRKFSLSVASIPAHFSIFLGGWIWSLTMFHMGKIVVFFFFFFFFC